MSTPIDCGEDRWEAKAEALAKKGIEFELARFHHEAHHSRCSTIAERYGFLCQVSGDGTSAKFMKLKVRGHL